MKCEVSLSFPPTLFWIHLCLHRDQTKEIISAVGVMVVKESQLSLEQSGVWAVSL